MLMLICVSLMGLLRWAWPIVIFLQRPFIWMGLVTILIAVTVDFAGIYRFKKLHTTTRPFREARDLVTDGIYRHTRNPMYLGLVLILLGVWILLGAISPIAPAAAFVLIADRWYIRLEEEMLSRKFGQEYQDYCRKTRRWI